MRWWGCIIISAGYSVIDRGHVQGLFPYLISFKSFYFLLSSNDRYFLLLLLPDTFSNMFNVVTL